MTPALLDRLVGIYCPDVPWVRAGVARILEDAREEGRQEAKKWLVIGTAVYVGVVIALLAWLFVWGWLG